MCGTVSLFLLLALQGSTGSINRIPDDVGKRFSYKKTYRSYGFCNRTFCEFATIYNYANYVS